MRIQVVSDLHVEHRPGMVRLKWWNPNNDVDVVVVAGDACSCSHMRRFSGMLKPVLESKVKVVYVPGNHETYGARDVDHYESQLRSHFAGREEEGLYLLDNGTAVLEDKAGKKVTFLGSTLYSDLSNPLDAMVVQNWPDFRLEGHSTDRHTLLHRKAVDFLHDGLFDAEGPTVVVTHFVPNPRSTHERFLFGHSSAANPYFCTDLRWLMNGPEAPDLWIHGHTHDPFDYQQGKTRVVCNPCGYPYELEGNGYAFDTAKIVEV